MTSLRLLIVLALVGALNESLAEPNAAPTPHAQAAAVKDLDIRYAEVYLQLATLQLQRAMDTNKQIPGTFTNTAIEALRQSVSVAEEQLKLLKSNTGQRMNMFLISAEGNARASAASYKRAQTIDRQNPGVIPHAELERLRLTADLAAISLEKAKSIGDQSSEAFLQWQIDQLREDFYTLRNQLAQIARMN